MSSPRMLSRGDNRPVGMCESAARNKTWQPVGMTPCDAQGRALRHSNDNNVSQFRGAAHISAWCYWLRKWLRIWDKLSSAISNAEKSHVLRKFARVSTGILNFSYVLSYIFSAAGSSNSQSDFFFHKQFGCWDVNYITHLYRTKNIF